MLRNSERKPQFNNFIKVLKRETPPRTVLFDFILGDEKEKMLTGEEYKVDTEFDRVVTRIKAFNSGGYDFAPIIIRGAEFPRKVDEHIKMQTKSLNSGALITDRKSFKEYKWPDVSNCDFTMIEKAGKYLEKGMKFIAYSHDGILENTIGIVGFENMCYMLYDDEELLGDIFFKVGEVIEAYFLECLKYDEVGVILCNDDWGFNSQTMLPPDVLRKYDFPWYKKIVQKVHETGKYAILHSCGYYDDIIDDIIDDMKFDGRHSYEDKICPVEKAYDDLHDRIAILGGIDINFLARSDSSMVYERSKKIVEKTKNKGYALGSGNSIPEFIPDENFIEMLKVALEEEEDKK